MIQAEKIHVLVKNAKSFGGILYFGRKKSCPTAVREVMRRGRQGHLRAAIALVATAAIAVSLFAATASASAAAPIVGVWSFSGGKVAIQAKADGTFTGTVVEQTQFAECPHPVGEEMWTGIRQQSDGSYWGSHQWFFTGSSCVANPELGPTAWRVLGNEKSRFLRVCFSEPGSGQQPTIAADGTAANATYGCADSARISSLPKLSSTKLARYAHLPGNKKCIGSKKLRAHLHDPPNDPFAKIKVTLKSGSLKRKASLKRKGHNTTATLNLVGLPRTNFTVKVKADTVLGNHLSLQRKYRLCAAPAAAR